MLGEKMRVYMDNAATTRVDEEVLEVMLPFLGERYGNPSSMHAMGIDAKTVVGDAREKVAKLLGADEKEIIFTGSGTESDNLAIFGYCRKNKSKGNHIITTKVEHHAVLDSFERLKKEGFEVTLLDVDRDGLIDLEELKRAITDNTIFASIIYANNEIGTVQPIAEAAKICKEKGVVLHTDACQATNYLEMDVTKIGADLITINGSKIYGPKGIGVLYKKRDIMIEPIIYGGGQEFGIRSGTENVANIVGFAKALDMALNHRDEESIRVGKLRDKLISGLLNLPESRLNGTHEKRLPNNANISFLNLEGESLLLYMNELGIYASTGSACSSDSLEPSHVIIALGLPHELGHSSIRFSLGKDTTESDIDYVLKEVPPIVEKLRKMSPLHKTMEEAIAAGVDKDFKH